MPEFKLSQPVNIIELITSAGLAASRSEARRLVEQNAVRLDGKTVSTVDQVVEPTAGAVLNVGKHKFVRLTA
jgi:tyrosyl-tRNA synthetase